DALERLDAAVALDQVLRFDDRHGDTPGGEDRYQKGSVAKPRYAVYPPAPSCSAYANGASARRSATRRLRRPSSTARSSGNTWRLRQPCVSGDSGSGVPW